MDIDFRPQVFLDFSFKLNINNLHFDENKKK